VRREQPPGILGTVTVPPILTEDSGDESGIYKLVVSVFLNSSIPGGKFDLMGFQEGPFIQIEDLA
jgi:hypothetical protein